MSQNLKLLIYDYVENIVEKRAPFRADHLAIIGGWVADGRAVGGGATGDPPSGALIVFRETGDPEEFASLDPYVQNGLVTSWRVEPWTVVTGDL